MPSQAAAVGGPASTVAARPHRGGGVFIDEHVLRAISGLDEAALARAGHTPLRGPAFSGNDRNGDSAHLLCRTHPVRDLDIRRRLDATDPET